MEQMFGYVKIILVRRYPGLLRVREDDFPWGKRYAVGELLLVWGEAPWLFQLSFEISPAGFNPRASPAALVCYTASR
jgi:hypothetical protein